MLSYFHEYMGINEYRYEKGDTLTFKDFNNPDIVQFKGGMPYILQDILKYVFDF